MKRGWKLPGRAGGPGCTAAWHRPAAPWRMRDRLDTRRAHPLVVRTASRRGAGAPPAEVRRGSRNCAHRKPSRGGGPAGRGAV